MHPLLDHFNFILIHGTNVPASYAMLFFTALDFIFMTRHIYNWALFLLWLSLFIPLELFLHSSPVAYWTPTKPGHSSFSVISLCLFLLFIGFSRKECWSGLPFSSPVDHILSELFIMTRLSWVALHGMTHSFIELNKVVFHVICLVSFLWLWLSFSLPTDGWGKDVCASFLMGRTGCGESWVLFGDKAMFSKSLIQFSANGWGCVPFLYGRGSGGNDNPLWKDLASKDFLVSAPDSKADNYWPTPPAETPKHSRQIWLSLLWGHCSFLLGPD